MPVTDNRKDVEEKLIVWNLKIVKSIIWNVKLNKSNEKVSALLDSGNEVNFIS